MVARTFVGSIHYWRIELATDLVVNFGKIALLLVGEGTCAWFRIFPFFVDFWTVVIGTGLARHKFPLDCLALFSAAHGTGLVRIKYLKLKTSDLSSIADDDFSISTMSRRAPKVRFRRSSTKAYFTSTASLLEPDVRLWPLLPTGLKPQYA